MTVLTVKDLGKSYKIYPTPRARFLELMTGRQRHKPFWALRDVSFEMQPGDCIGVIGDNGAGKSTLLKLITGTLQPTTGSARHQGRLTAILELGAGFHPEFSGRDNVFFAASLMGISREEIEGCFGDIVAFSELGNVIDRPVKTYSSGMFMRLAFSLITSVHPDILIVDEALAVGDQHFQKKCIDRMIEIKGKGTAILFCSHSMHHIKQFCERALWIDGGAVIADGEVDSVVDAYVSAQMEQESPADQGQSADISREPEQHYCMVSSVRLLSPKPAYTRGDVLDFEMQFTVFKERTYVYALSIDRGDGSRLATESSLSAGIAPVCYRPGEYRVVVRFDSAFLTAGRYEVCVGLLDESLLHIDGFQSVDLMIVEPETKTMTGMVRTQVEWDTEPDAKILNQSGDEEQAAG